MLPSAYAVGLRGSDRRHRRLGRAPAARTACVSLCWALGLLLGWHIYLIGTGQSTIEFYANRTARAEHRAARPDGRVARDSAT